MIKKYAFKTICLFVTISVFSSCKKDYTCTCTDPSGNKEVVFTQKTTEGKASSQCDEYYNNHYGNVPWNQTSCSIY
ncbi:MAG: hypothetical protein NTX97_01195 [Bacteroidetes bacterium]|nr:hypothetical protein [Bacteroidota bacterium]